jgi:dTDP-4-dehydrorhamnose reductase
VTTLVVSPDGMLGRAFVEALERRGEPVIGVSYPELDLTRPATLARIDGAIGRVINCAAFTDVDGAEAREAEALAVNGTGVGHLAAACARVGATLVHFGTDYVFSGDAAAPYPVDAPVAPRTAYGRTKAAGEAALRDSGADHLYLRTSWLYAPWGKNFVRTIAALGKTKPELKVVDDQRGRPTSAEELVVTTLALWDRGARGFFHATDGGECTWFDFAKAIVEGTGGSAKVLPCTTAEFPRPAPRPAYSVLDLSATEAVLGRPLRHWRETLADVLPRLVP